MDRRYRAILKIGATVWVWVWTAAMVVSGGDLRAEPSPGQNQAVAQSSPAGSATPWVQAAPPGPQVPQNQQAQQQNHLAATPTPTVAVTLSPTPTPSPKPTATPAPTPTPSAPKPSPPSATPKPTVARPPALPAVAGPSAEEAKAKMLRERERELNSSQTFGPQTLPPDEQVTFQNNARIWNKLLPEEQQSILGQAGRRIREETEQAYDQTGLSLNDDQREVFALRYRQERRRLERELQDKANNERNRRVPQILEQLKREFGRASSGPGGGNNGNGNGGGAPKGSPVPSSTQPPPLPSAAVNGTVGGAEMKTL